MQDAVRVEDVAAALQVSVGLLRRQLREVPVEGELTSPETSALARLDRGGPTTASALAKLEQITAQSMGTTLGGLRARGLIEPTTDPNDGRRVVLSITKAGLDALRIRRNARSDQLAQALSTGFTRAELKHLMAAAPLIERLAQQL